MERGNMRCMSQGKVGGHKMALKGSEEHATGIMR